MQTMHQLVKTNIRKISQSEMNVDEQPNDNDE